MTDRRCKAPGCRRRLPNNSEHGYCARHCRGALCRYCHADLRRPGSCYCGPCLAAVRGVARSLGRRKEGPPPPPWVAERIARYAELARRGLPLFEPTEADHAEG